MGYCGAAEVRQPTPLTPLEYFREFYQREIREYNEEVPELLEHLIERAYDVYEHEQNLTPERQAEYSHHALRANTALHELDKVVADITQGMRIETERQKRHICYNIAVAEVELSKMQTILR